MKKVSERVLFKGNWLTIVEADYINQRGESFQWESVRRRKAWTGVVIVAKLIPSQRFVLIKQFRPAIDGCILGFPAGLAEEDYNHALTELQEETGYVGEIVEVSPRLKSNSGIVNDNGQVVFVHVDENDPRNQNPQQLLEPSEQIEVVLLKKEEMKDFLLEETKRGTAIGANLWYLFVMSQCI